MGFLRGSVVKNLPANAGVMGLIPGPGRSRMPRGNDARAPQLLSLGSGAQGPRLLKPTYPTAYAPQQEKPLQWEGHAAQLESGHHSAQLEEQAWAAMNTQHSYKEIHEFLNVI